MRLDRRLAFVAFSLSLVPALAARANRPSREERLKQCTADRASKTTPCFTEAQVEKKGPVTVNLRYGWNVGKGHPAFNDRPPSYASLLNGMDQCAWFHDRHAWRWNATTHFCEAWELCANTVGLIRCVEAYQPESPLEAEQKKKILAVSAPGKACIPALYKKYGVGFERDKHGSQWMSPAAIKELAQAFDKCKGAAMGSPGFDFAKARAGTRQ